MRAKVHKIIAQIPAATIFSISGGSVIDGDCLLAQPIGGLLWRKPTLKPGEAAAIADPWEPFGKRG